MTDVIDSDDSASSSEYHHSNDDSSVAQSYESSEHEFVPELFDSEESSDITLVFNGERIHAHKHILAQNSTWFRAAFRSGFTETHTDRLVLHEDESEAFRGMIAHLYGLWYDGEGGYSLYEDVVADDPFFIGDHGNPYGYMHYLLNLYITADKYGAEDLATEIFWRMDWNWEELWEGWYHEFEVFAQRVYEFESMKDLRPDLASFVAEEIGKDDDDDTMEKVVRRIPELMFDVMIFLAKENKELKGEDSK